MSSNKAEPRRAEGFDKSKTGLNDNELYDLFQLLSKKNGTLKLEISNYDIGSIKKRIELLKTILIHQNKLNKNFRFSTINKLYSFLYYLLNKLSNKELKDIITNGQKNERKKNLLDGIESKAKELIEIINKKEKESERQQDLMKRRQEIKTWKTHILKHINKDDKYLEDKRKSTTLDNHYIRGKKINVNLENYIILEREDHEETATIDGLAKGHLDTTTIYYLLYKDQEIYTMKIVHLNKSDNYQGINNPILLEIEDEKNLNSYSYTFYYLPLLSKLYNELIKPQQGGKLTTTPVYKLNGEKVSLLINKKKLYRSIYVKGNGNRKAKYCKINNEFVLLSKLKIRL
jgi:hypothetical protein